MRELENLIERLVINTPPTGLVSAADLSFDVEFNSLADPDKPQEFILSSRLNCLNNSAASMRHLLNRQELDSYLRELAQVNGDVKGGTTIRHQAHNSSHAHKKIRKETGIATGKHD